MASIAKKVCAILWAALSVGIGCGQTPLVEVSGTPPAAETTSGTILLTADTGSSATPRVPASFASEPDRDSSRQRMVERHLAGRDITHPAIIAAMSRVPRHLFVPESMRKLAYEDGPLPIGHDQTISQPYIVAIMTQLLEPKATDRILEVGTGSGYQAAILAEIVDEVVTIEIVDALARESAGRLKTLGYRNITVVSGDGYAGWPSRAPYDGIMVTAAPEKIPAPLIEQLKPGGRMVVPVGAQGQIQYLTLARKKADGSLEIESKLAVRFVPMTGAARGE